VTAQIQDTFHHRNREYSLVGISEGELFDPSLLGMKPVGLCSACWRGYHAVFGLSGTRLVLDELHIYLAAPGDDLQREPGPEINGVKPAGPQGKHDWFNNHYRGLGYHLEYSGGLLLADGFIEELYVHMGFHPAWKYETVIELVFDAGVLKGEFDRSAQMAEIRATVAARRDRDDLARRRTREEIAKFVERAFDRRYSL
jgi:hypothetical protein